MARSLYHLPAVTGEPERVVSFLRDVIGMPENRRVHVKAAIPARTLGWPASAPDTTATLMGEGRGLIEVFAIPEGLAGTVTPGFKMATFLTPNVEERAQLCRDLGYAVEDPRRVQTDDLDVTVAIVRVGELMFEMVRYES